ncbi:MAG TPA: hypothetical protein VHO67_10335 [Polyangia bacterium]|nr:hypothetical protein [Polyangia bacterium]
MSVEVERATLPCSVCGASVTELRRGRCWGCYTRWAETRPVGRGAACATCGEKRRAQLKLVEIWRRSLPFCHGCAAAVMRLPEIPSTVEELRHALRRDRRDGDRRTGAKADHRIFPRERRVGERRGPSRDAFADTDPRIKLAELQMEEVVLELGDSDIEPGDQTQVRPSPPKAAIADAAAVEDAAAMQAAPMEAAAVETPAVEAAQVDAPVETPAVAAASVEAEVIEAPAVDAAAVETSAKG